MNEIKITIEGLSELTAAILKLAGNEVSVKTDTIPVATIPAAPLPLTPPQIPNVPQIPVMQNQPAVPVGATVTLPMTPIPTQAQALPTTAATQEYTIEQLQVAAAGLTNMGKMPQIMGILQQFGIQAMTELPKEKYGAFAFALREAGAQI
jgi:hypothetical protein